MTRTVLAIAVAGLVCTACQQPNPRLNAPPHGDTHYRHPLQSTYVHMEDNALLEDMTVSDMHFLPHRAMLSTLGEERLSRLALLVDEYGGTIRFNTDLTDDELIDARTDTIIAFLEESGIDVATKPVRRDLPGGRGMHAEEAILIKVNEGTYQPDEQSGSESSAGPLF